MKTIPVNKWTITATIATSLLLIGVGGASATPETKVEYQTQYKTRTIEKPVEKIVYRDKTGLSDTCREALVGSVQSMYDFMGLISDIADVITGDSYDTQGVLDNQEQINAKALEATQSAVVCDSTISNDVDLRQ